MDIELREIYDYILHHYTFVGGGTYTCDLGKGYRIILNDGMFNTNLKFIKNNRVVKEIIDRDTQVFKGVNSIYDLIDYYEEILDEKYRKERERLKEIRTFFSK